MIRKLILWLTKLYKINKPESGYISPSSPKLDTHDLYNMVECSLDMWLTDGKYSNMFSKKLSNYLGVKYITLTNSGSSANLAAISALTSPKLKDRRLCYGDEVITLACGFPTTVFPIIQCELTPVFVDIEKRTLNINVNQIIESITPKTKAIFIANTLGNPANWKAIREIADKHKLWVIVDNCDSLASEYDNKKCGSIGDINTFSFFPAHEITGGEMGAVATHNPLLHTILNSVTSWGRDCRCKPGQNNVCGMRFETKHGRLPLGFDHKYIFSELGYNMKPTEWQAAIASSQIDKINMFSNLRRVNYDFIWKTLKQYEEHLILQYKYNLESYPVWFGVPIILKSHSPFNKLNMVKYLEYNGVGTREIFAGNILRHPVFTNNSVWLRIRNSELLNSAFISEEHYSMLPETEYVMNNGFWIGCHQAMTKDNLRKVGNVIHRYFND